MSDIVACICEGAAEEAIINLLLDSQLLVFERSDLLEETIFRRMNPKVFCANHLSRNFGERKVRINRILDSKKEKFEILRTYKKKVSMNEVYCTCPEIEMLIIISEKRAEEYNRKYKSRHKPSAYCKKFLRLSNVKNKEFVNEYYRDAHKLVDAIKEYKRIHSFGPNEKCLCDLLKNSIIVNS